MKQLYTRLVNLGIQEGMDPAERRAIGLINRISLMGICIFLSLSIIPYFFNYDLVSLFTGTINIAVF